MSIPTQNPEEPKFVGYVVQKIDSNGKVRSIVVGYAIPEGGGEATLIQIELSGIGKKEIQSAIELKSNPSVRLIKEVQLLPDATKIFIDLRTTDQSEINRFSAFLYDHNPYPWGKEVAKPFSNYDAVFFDYKQDIPPVRIYKGSPETGRQLAKMIWELGKKPSDAVMIMAHGIGLPGAVIIGVGGAGSTPITLDDFIQSWKDLNPEPLMPGVPRKGASTLIFYSCSAGGGGDQSFAQKLVNAVDGVTAWSSAVDNTPYYRAMINHNGQWLGDADEVSIDNAYNELTNKWFSVGTETGSIEVFKKEWLKISSSFKAKYPGPAPFFTFSGAFLDCGFSNGFLIPFAKK